MKINAYEIEKADEKIAEDERKFMKSVLLYLPLILVGMLFDNIKKLIK